MLLVIGSSGGYDINDIKENYEMDQILFVITDGVSHSHDVKELRELCNERFIEFNVTIFVPPIDTVTENLLSSIGFCYDPEVRVYGV